VMCISASSMTLKLMKNFINSKLKSKSGKFLIKQ